MLSLLKTVVGRILGTGLFLVGTLHADDVSLSLDSKDTQDYVDTEKDVSFLNEEDVKAIEKPNLEKAYEDAQAFLVKEGTPPIPDDPLKDPSCPDCQGQIEHHPSPEAVWDNGVLVFVSLSMPKASLVALRQEALQRGATLVIRGLYDNSFLKTKDKIVEIHPEGLPLMIHPQLFKEYHVERVPTFIEIRDGQEVARLRGNVTLDFALSKLRAQP